MSGKTHGLTYSKIYYVWCNMLARCRNPNKPEYVNYGGRGISVCKEWHSFEAFYADMGDAPFEGAQLDRIDNDGDYTKDNCRWVTAATNLKNKRNNLMFTHEGKTQCLMDWAKEYGLNYKTLSNRLQRSKMPLELALNMPINNHWRKYENSHRG